MLIGDTTSPEYFDKLHNGRWNGYTIVSMGIGQGELGTTPIQIANMVATIANRGYYIIPHAVKDIEGQQIDKRFRTKNYIGISPSYFNVAVEGMRMSVTGGTSRIADIPGIEVCGKTGTAQNPTGTKKDHSVFVAFAPKDNPKIAIAVYVENAGFGATYAAPIASLMIEKYLKDSVTRKPLEDRIVNMDLTTELKYVFAAQKAAKEAKERAKKAKSDSLKNAARPAASSSEDRRKMPKGESKKPGVFPSIKRTSTNK